VRLRSKSVVQTAPGNCRNNIRTYCSRSNCSGFVIILTAASSEKDRKRSRHGGASLCAYVIMPVIEFVAAYDSRNGLRAKRRSQRRQKAEDDRCVPTSHPRNICNTTSVSACFVVPRIFTKFIAGNPHRGSVHLRNAAARVHSYTGAARI
jgi:hypothetical protein